MAFNMTEWNELEHEDHEYGYFVFYALPSVSTIATEINVVHYSAID